MTRLLGLLMLLCASCALGSAAAHADTVTAKKAEYAAAEAQVARLDRRVERLTERYNDLSWRLDLLNGRIRVAVRRLHAARVELDHDLRVLAELVVNAYKTPLPTDTSILLGASDLSEFITVSETRDRFDASIADAADAVRAERAAIAQHRAELSRERDQTRERQAQISKLRRRIVADLARRRRLALLLAGEVRVAVAADRAGQADLALQAASWIEADIRSRGSTDPLAALRDRVALEGLEQIGVPYRWAGASPETGFDCSGLIMWLWSNHGVELPHYAAAQYGLGMHVGVADLQIGDLVFFHDLRHVAMYIGHGYVLHAPHPGDVVRIAPLGGARFSATYDGATRTI
jgi:cell wall-associated NlpC family hydrolase